MWFSRAQITVNVLTLFLLCGFAQAAGSATAPARLAPPDRAELARASRHVDELLSRNAPRDSESLLKLAGETTSSPALRYAATVRAIEQAADSANVPAALRGLEELSDHFDIDRHKARLDLLRRFAKDEADRSVSILAMRWIEDCYVDGRMEVAVKMAELLRRRQTRLSEPLAGSVSEFLADHQFAQSCRQNGSTRPASCLFECLYQDIWDTNLQVLAGGDDVLAATAKEDLTAKDVPSRVRVAEQWWARGATRGGLTGWRIARRAVAIYEQLLPQTDGVERELIAARLAQHAATSLQFRAFAQGILREVSRAGSRDRKATVVQDIQLAKDDVSLDVPRVDPQVTYRGLFLVSAPGSYDFIFTGGSSIRADIDSKRLVDNPTAFRRRSGETCTIELPAGLHTIEIEVASSASRPRLSVEWITPGATEKCLMPAGVLFYDPLTLPAGR